MVSHLNGFKIQDGWQSWLVNAAIMNSRVTSLTILKQLVLALLLT